jgi:hypothetical protein
MKKVFRKTADLLIAIFLLSSCTISRVAFPTIATEKIDKIALLSTYIDIQKPVLPLIDAAVINGKTNSISGEITSMFMDNVKIVRENVAKLLKDKLNCEVIYGTDLQNIPNFKEAKTAFNIDNALIKNDSHFPEIAADMEDIHPFEFNNADVKAYFKTPANYKSIVVGICKMLQVNNIAISYTFLATAPGSIYYKSSVADWSYLYIFNRNGDCIASGWNVLQPIPFKAGEVEGYQLALDRQSETIQPRIEEIAARFRNQSSK